MSRHLIYTIHVLFSSCNRSNHCMPVRLAMLWLRLGLDSGSSGESLPAEERRMLDWAVYGGVKQSEKLGEMSVGSVTIRRS